jgi:hypothetical protein
MKTFATSSALLIGALVLFVIGMFGGNGGLMMGIFCLWTPLAIFWGYSVGRLRIRFIVENPMQSTPKSSSIRKTRLMEGH